MNKIYVQIFGIKNAAMDHGCPTSCKDGCGEHRCGSCIKGKYGSQIDSKNVSKTMWDYFEELAKLIEESDVGEKTYLEFIDIDKLGEIHPYGDIIDLRDRGFDAPITVIDGIVRYYGGISGKLIYKDIKELLS